MKKKLFKILPWLLLVISIIFIVLLIGKRELSKTDYLYGNNVSSAEKITCRYPQTASAYVANDEVEYIIPEKETNPLIFTFSGYDKQIAEISYVDANQTITTVPIVVFENSEDKLTLIEGGGDNYLTIHTIYKGKGISSYTKQVDLLGTPSTTMSFGYCFLSL